MIKLPILRAGKYYHSLDSYTLPHFQTGETVAIVSRANRGLIMRDMNKLQDAQEKLNRFSASELIEICKKAAHHFRSSNLPMNEDQLQSPQDYIDQLSATTGMPKSLCQRNMDKIILVMEEMEAVLGGLTRGLDLEVLDKGWVNQNGRSLSFIRETDALGAVLPSNSPGVHSLWMPSIPLKVPLVLKPGSQEPWSPFRIAQAFIAAGAPPEAFNIYPTDYNGAAEILIKTGRSMLFGDKNTVAPWKKDTRVQLHGPGWSKVIIGEDKIDNWKSYVDLIVSSASANGGRSCINASGVWVPKYGREIAEELAKEFAKFEARAIDDPLADIAAFSNPIVAERIDEMISQQLTQAGAIDLTNQYRKGGRLVRKDGCTFLLPTVVWCEDHTHPLANAEFLFPYISVCESSQAEVLEKIGNTLIVSAITEDNKFIQELFASHNVDRLNIGIVPTWKISWDQPHEGNLFEHLYRQRALQMAI